MHTFGMVVTLQLHVHTPEEVELVQLENDMLGA